MADPDEASPLDADRDPPSAPEEVALVVPEPERAPDPKTASVAPETAPVAPEPPLVALVTLPVRSETTVVCEVIVEIAEVTVPIGSRSCAPAIAALLATPPSARMTRTRSRIAADRIPSSVYPFLDEQTPNREDS